MDCSEIIKGSCFNNQGKKSNRRVRWDNKLCPEDDKLEEPEKSEDENDEFEKEMLTVIEDRIHKAEVDGGIKSNYTSENQKGKQKSPVKPGQDTSSSSKTLYDPIYFDSDDDSDEQSNLESSNQKRKEVFSNDELLYDPNLDGEDQAWADNIRTSYQGANNHSGVPTDNPKPAKNSSAVLNCPACFVVLCIDCQQHETYHHQFRAMFVMNCIGDKSQKLTFPAPKSKSRKKGKQSTQQMEFNNEIDPDEVFNPVKCKQCSTQVAVYDSEEVYHFFNVLAAHG